MRNRYRNYLSMQALVVLEVFLLFKFLEIREFAALCASLSFLISTLAILFFEVRYANYFKRPSFLAASVFVAFGLLPMIALRLVYWEQPFGDLSILKIRGDDLHRLSNYFFMIMMVCFFIDSHKENTKAQ